MGPKIEAACRFAEATGRPAAIGQLTDAPRLLTGAAGTSSAGSRRKSSAAPGLTCTYAL